jgi:serine phosphatase RsbU (regulator of sigma subunit)
MADESTRKYPGGDGELVAKGKDFEIYRAQRGSFEVIRLKGKSTPDLLSQLREKVLKQTKHFAIDTASLADPGFPLARELSLTARRLRNMGRNVVLLNARGPFRDLIRAASPDDSIQFVPAELMLDGDMRAFSKRMREARQELSLIRTEVENNPAWQLIDREQAWLCPFCGTVQDHIRFNPRLLVLDVSIEMIYLHHTEGCADRKSGKPLRTMASLSDVIRETNVEKMKASKSTASALATRVVELEGRVREVEELEQSVRIASERQRHLLPTSVPEIPGVITALGYWPSNTVSGDFYDFIDLGEARFGILIGDVAGHGIEAGILMGVAKKVASIRLRDTRDPAMALQMANRDIYPDLDRKTFVSALLAVYDAVTRELTYVRAGHNPPILFNPERAPQFTKLEADGLVLGLDSGPRFNQVMVKETVALQEGDSIFFYTDGLVEAKNRNGEEFGMQRVYEQIRFHHDAPPEDFVNALAEQVRMFAEGEPQEDDVTAILMRLQ